ncbi:hypothetical protein BpHYR1_012172, partial [Brachionus plicatilis]
YKNYSTKSEKAIIKFQILEKWFYKEYNIVQICTKEFQALQKLCNFLVFAELGILLQILVQYCTL